MADMMPLVIGGALLVGGYFLIQSGALSGLGQQPAAVPVAQQTGNFPEQQLVSQTPGIGNIVITPDIILMARSDILEPIVLCDLDSRRHEQSDEGHNIDASIKIWEQEHNQTFHTIKERNEHTHMRCRIVHFYHDIDWRIDFDDPIRQHICLNKRVIIDEDRRGRFDSPRANSAALDVAHVTTPLIQSCTKCTVNISNVTNVPTTTSIINSPGAAVVNKPAVSTAAAGPARTIAPGANTPPIPHNHPASQHASTTPTTPVIAAQGRWY
jgi:hypothetical protein